jgi:hypothetical protein
VQNQVDVKYLNPSNVQLTRGSGGLLEGMIDGVHYPEITLRSIFPLSRPKQYISVRLPDGVEIGIIPDLSDLDTDSMREAEQELRFRYIVPVVTRIDQIVEESGLWIWNLQTDRGPLRLIMQNLHEYIIAPSPTRLIITDMDGRRCEISDIHTLDSHSRKELNKIL